MDLGNMDKFPQDIPKFLALVIKIIYIFGEKFSLKEGEMKALVAYYSDTGNTEKIARGVYEGIEQAEKEILPIEQVKDVEDFDIIFCGFPVLSHSVPGTAQAFIKNIPEGKKVAFFATHGSLRGGQLAVQAFYYALSLASKETVLGTFGCRGKVKSSIIDALMKKAEHRSWAIEAQSAVGHPDQGDLEDAKSWAKAMIAKARAQ
jgi:flavodoxin